MGATYLSLRTILLVGGVILVGIILLVILLLSRRKPSTSPLPQSASVASSPEERQAILQKLADGELSKAEAEEQLNDPIPVTMPAPPPRSGATKGCLITLLILPFLLLLFLLTIYILFSQTVV